MTKKSDRQRWFASIEALATAGRYDDVIREVNRLQGDLQEFRWQALLLRRDAYEKTGQWALALAEWTTAGSKEPSYVGEYRDKHQRDRARCLKNLHHWAAAEELLEQYIKEHKGAVRALGQVELEMLLKEQNDKSPGTQLALLNQALPHLTYVQDINYTTTRLAVLKKMIADRKAKHKLQKQEAAKGASVATEKKKRVDVHVDGDGGDNDDDDDDDVSEVRIPAKKCVSLAKTMSTTAVSTKPTNHSTTVTVGTTGDEDAKVATTSLDSLKGAKRAPVGDEDEPRKKRKLDPVSLPVPPTTDMTTISTVLNAQADVLLAAFHSQSQSLLTAVADIRCRMSEVLGAVRTLKPQCTICYSRAREVRFSCGHVACCQLCTDDLKSSSAPLCPSCTAPIGDTLKIIL